ncbi:tetratricopeptide repeat protein [Amycolatopsis umgeniensis]|uniref:Tetratricopeptide (TPR) repeat protein n=1 Tax=Amycolatopsis umgeniensis TaxID=336628 RepID=A0A841BCL7_9PSEU|nr:hypothetical protein [Amycolatopsis umgeniensis]MBB5856458.1 tetratricopeptide (TPR) repeat protein [Amycolatopsis umgeniensis]
MTAIDPISGPVRPGGRVEKSALASSPVSRPRVRQGGEAGLRRELDEWSQNAAEFAERLRVIVYGGTPNATAFSRLAHAELAAENSEDAVRAADDCLNLVVQDGHRGSFDAATAIAAIRLFLQVGYRSKVFYWLDRLPRTETLRRIRASLAAEEKRWDDVIEILDGLESPEADALRGYTLLSQGKPAEALKELRSSARFETDPDTLLNMAFAFWQLGSRKKAIHHAMQAARLAPFRRDIVFAFIELLLAAGDVQLASTEIASLKQRDVVETPNFLVLQARVSLEAEQKVKALALLKRALGDARSAGIEGLVTEIESNLAIMNFREKCKTPEDYQQKLRRAIQKNPKDIILIQSLAESLNKSSNAAELRQLIAPLDGEYAEESLLFLRYRVAYLELRFRKAAALALKWSQHDHFEPNAVSAAFLIHAEVTGDLELSCSMARSALSRFRHDALLVNNAAYVLATAGRAKEARAAVHQIEEKPFYLVATAGLVELTLGHIDSGLKLYRKASAMVDDYWDSNAKLALMRLHQVLSLRRLGIYDKIDSMELFAKSLPDVNLPSEWQERPEFVLLWRIFRSNRWPWPWAAE